MSGDGKTLTVERARRELRRLLAFREPEQRNSRKFNRRKIRELEMGGLVLALFALPFELLGFVSCYPMGRGLRTRFERLQRLDKLIEEREDELVASSLRLRVHPATHKGLD